MTDESEQKHEAEMLPEAPGVAIAQRQDGKWIFIIRVTRSDELQYESGGGSIHHALHVARVLRDSLSYIIQKSEESPDFTATPTPYRGH